LRFFHNLEIFKFFLTDGPNCDTRYVVSNARKVGLTLEMWCRPDCLYNKYICFIFIIFLILESLVGLDTTGLIYYSEAIHLYKYIYV
jgi:hypothetical protein